MSQYSIEKDEFLNTNKSIYECFMLADSVTGELNSDYYRAFVNAGYYTPKGRLQTSQQQVTYFSTNIFASGNDFWDNYTANNANRISNAWSAIPFVPIRKELTNISSNTAATLLSLSSAFSLDGSSTSPGVAMSQGRFNQTLATKDVFLSYS